MKQQKGFSLVEGLLIVLILCVIGFAGFYVWDRSQEDESPVSENQTTAIEPADTEDQAENVAQETEALSASWKEYNSGQSGYSIKIADGLNGLRDASTDLFVFRSYTTNEGVAVVEDINGYGADGFSAVIIDRRTNPWSPTERLNEQVVDFTTYEGVVGTKSSFSSPYRPPCEGPGCYLGTMHVLYEFTNTDTEEITRLWYSRRVVNEETQRLYDLSEADPDYTEFVDEMVRTLKIN